MKDNNLNNENQEFEIINTNIEWTPYYEEILGLNSIELVNRLEDIDYRDGEKFQFNYDKLHEYDNRYKISWDFYKN